MLGCEEAREEFSALLDGEIDTGRRTAVESHLSECSDCLRELGRYQKIAALYLGLDPVRAPEGFEARVARAIRPKTRLRSVHHFAWYAVLPAMAAAAVAIIAFLYFGASPTVENGPETQVAPLKTPAETPAADPAAGEPHATAAGRNFVLREGVWREASYAGEATKTVVYGTEACNALLRDNPMLSEVAALKHKVILLVEQTWYLLEFPEEAHP